MKRVIVTGSSGLIGSEAAAYFSGRGFRFFIEAFVRAPRCAEVYNIGGGFSNSCSILEAFQRVEALSGKPMDYVYVDSPRQGDHICYYSDLSKIRRDYPDWELSKSLDAIFSEIAEGWRMR